jgi:hypothetical protein
MQFHCSRFCAFSPVAAGALFAASITFAAESPAETFRPSDHGPAGVMTDHMHEAGEFMIGYRYMFDYSGDAMLRGWDEIDDMPLAHAGFASTPERMTMHMHMLDLMYAPTDWLTLMLMPQHMTMNMRMRDVAGAIGHDEHEEEEGAHSGHGAGPHEHSTSGLGDTVMTALVRLLEKNGHHVHIALGLSAPTGSVSERGHDGKFTHYMMQLGSGTWDFLPSLTYTGHSGAWGWGGQISANIKLEDENDSGFRFGDRYQGTLWGSRDLTDWLSGSVRLSYWGQGDISGHYNGAHTVRARPICKPIIAVSSLRSAWD